MAVLTIFLIFSQLRNLQQWYIEEFKDPLLQNSPVWFKSFLFCELVFQLPFFPIAAYAVFKGKWRNPIFALGPGLRNLWGKFHQGRGMVSGGCVRVIQEWKRSGSIL